MRRPKNTRPLEKAGGGQETGHLLKTLPNTDLRATFGGREGDPLLMQKGAAENAPDHGDRIPLIYSLLKRLCGGADRDRDDRLYPADTSGRHR